MEELLFTPKMDIIFKRIFGDERNKNIIISFLNAVLGIKKTELLDLTILSNELLPDFQNEKQGILDLKLKLINGELINIEIQIFPYNNMKERILYYLTRMFVSQIEKGENYNQLRKCINITILDYNLLKGNNVHSIYNFIEKEDYNPFTDKLEIHLLELRKLKNNNENLLNLWLQFLNSKKKEEFEMLSLKDEDIKKAYEVLDELNKDPKLREYYEMLNKWDHDRASMIHDTKKWAYNEGIQQGKVEITKSIALKMLNANSDLNFICEVTGLSIDDLKKIKNNL